MANFIPKLAWPLDTAANTYTFPNMPEGDPLGEVLTPNWDIMIANKGKRYVQYNHTEQDFSVNFTFLSEADYAAIVNFHKTHAALGKTFRYYEHSDLSTYFSMQLLDGILGWTAVVSDGAGGMLRNLTLNLRGYYV